MDNICLKHERNLKTLCPIHVVTFTLISNLVTDYIQKRRGEPGSNVSTTPLLQWSFRQCLPFSWTKFVGKHCRHPIALMGVAYTFRHWLCTCIFKSDHCFLFVAKNISSCPKQILGNQNIRYDGIFAYQKCLEIDAKNTLLQKLFYCIVLCMWHLLSSCQEETAMKTSTTYKSTRQGPICITKCVHGN